MDTDSARWQRIREQFESLPAGDWTLSWSDHPLVGPSGLQFQSHWEWFGTADPSLCARASAIFAKAAKALGYDHKDRWLDKLRDANFTGLQINGGGVKKLPDGTEVGVKNGLLEDAIKHSITLCHQFEAEAATLTPVKQATETKWAVCRRPDDIPDSTEPQWFATKEDAEAFLEAEVPFPSDPNEHPATPLKFSDPPRSRYKRSWSNALSARFISTDI